MRLQGHTNTLETNSESESKSFSIGDASVIIEILRNRLYENKIQTLVQEYICNARDAMREVGKGNDFNVTMPTRLQPTFKVRDFGPGISPERMEKVFILYGASTKRGTNNQTGGFGIGAKSAWSYTDSFTVVTVIDGVRRTYVCHTGHNNQGSLDLVSTDHTDEPNGTEIQVAVKHHDLHEFQAAIYRAIYFWKERPKVNATDGIPAFTLGYQISDNVEFVRRNTLPQFIGLDYYAKALAVIDGVPYPITEKLLSKAVNLSNFVNQSVFQTVILHFSNGLVEVSASRESIADSQYTVDALNKMGLRASGLVRDHMKSEFAKVNSISTWIETYRRLKGFFHVGSESEYGDYRIESDRIVSDSLKTVKMTVAHCLDRHGRYKVNRITRDERTNNDNKNIPIDLIDQVYIVTKNESTIVQNKRLRAFFDGKPEKLSKVILLEYGGDPAILDGIVSDLGVKVFEEIEIPKVTKKPKVKIERENEEFCIYNFARKCYSYIKLAGNEKKYLYVETNREGWSDFSSSDFSNLSSYINSNFDEGQGPTEIVSLGSRAVKIVRGDKNFVPFAEWLENYKVSDRDIEVAISNIAQNKGNMITVEGLIGIEDSFLTEMQKIYSEILVNVRCIPKILEQKLKENDEVKEFEEKDARLSKTIKQKYPLIEGLNRYIDYRNELVHYINAKYKV